MGILEIYLREKALFDFGIEGSLTLGIFFFGTCWIVANVGPLTYRLDLPSGLVRVHNVFHVCLHRMYIPYPSHVLPEQSFTLRDVLTHVKPVQILNLRDHCFRVLVISVSQGTLEKSFS